jgi:hypothetical protein
MVRIRIVSHGATAAHSPRATAITVHDGRYLWLRVRCQGSLYAKQDHDASRFDGGDFRPDVLNHVACKCPTAARASFTVGKREIFYRYPTGEAARTSNSVFSVRPDGTHVEVRGVPVPDGSVKQLKILIDTTAKRRVVSDEVTRSISTTALSDAYVATLKNKPSACTTEPAPQRTTILGHIALKVVNTIPSSPGFTMTWRVG